VTPKSVKTTASHAPTSLVRASLMRDIWAVWNKDFRSEWRGRAALNAVCLFSIAAPVALGFTLAKQKLEPEALGGLLWTTLFFAALLGLPRAFVKEEESGTAALLRLHFSSDAVLWGKVIGQLALLGVTQLAAVPLFVLLLGAKVTSPLLLLLCVILGDVGLAVSSTVLGAMAAQVRSKGALFSALAVPLMLPLLFSVSVASGAAFGARMDAVPGLQVVAAFDLVLLAAAWMTFDFVWS
jgi:heme exporter protein B